MSADIRYIPVMLVHLLATTLNGADCCHRRTSGQGIRVLSASTRSRPVQAVRSGPRLICPARYNVLYSLDSISGNAGIPSPTSLQSTTLATE